MRDGRNSGINPLTPTPLAVIRRGKENFESADEGEETLILNSFHGLDVESVDKFADSRDEEGFIDDQRRGVLTVGTPESRRVGNMAEENHEFRRGSLQNWQICVGEDELHDHVRGTLGDDVTIHVIRTSGEDIQITSDSRAGNREHQSREGNTDDDGELISNGTRNSRGTASSADYDSASGLSLQTAPPVTLSASTTINTMPPTIITALLTNPSTMPVNNTAPFTVVYQNSSGASNPNGKIHTQASPRQGPVGSTLRHHHGKAQWGYHNILDPLMKDMVVNKDNGRRETGRFSTENRYWDDSDQRGHGGQLQLQRNEVIALVNLLNRLSESVKLIREMGPSVEKIIEAQDAPSTHQSNTLTKFWNFFIRHGNIFAYSARQSSINDDA
ncbi:hypothetical protein GIB67_038633 [Kingdonia uniflora]|uniref:Uncharacterized protein n=1 Tax=Kingdonia uniflora TaxID=39325 RepID=A0A7J7NPN8_9MAGN|nr:hypothetical protein GIB67_038633 [Kingdonia uniflora]